MSDPTDPPTAADADAVTYVRDPAERPSRSVVRAVADANGTDPLQIEPLYDTVDPESVDRLFDTATDRDRSLTDVTVSFRFGDCEVTVHGDGRTVVTPTD